MTYFLMIFILTGLTPCLVKNTLGVFLLSSASCQHSKVSIRSAGLNTFKFGIDLNLLTVQQVGVLPSSARRIESCVNILFNSLFHHC